MRSWGRRPEATEKCDSEESRQGLLSLAGDGGVSLVSLLSAASAAPRWQGRVAQGAAFRGWRRAAQLSFPHPCTNAMVDTEPDGHTEARKFSSNENYLICGNQHTNAACAVHIHPTKRFRVVSGLEGRPRYSSLQSTTRVKTLP